MNKLYRFTGGSITLDIAIICLALIALVIGTIKIVTNIVKNKDIPRSQKIELIICIISSVLIASFIGGIIGYYFGILKIL